MFKKLLTALTALVMGGGMLVGQVTVLPTSSGSGGGGGTNCTPVNIGGSSNPINFSTALAGGRCQNIVLTPTSAVTGLTFSGGLDTFSDMFVQFVQGGTGYTVDPSGFASNLHSNGCTPAATSLAVTNWTIHYIAGTDVYDVIGCSSPNAPTPLPVSAGGIGVGTVTGIVKGNGTSPVSGITLPADATKYLDGTGAFTVPTGGSSPLLYGASTNAVAGSSAALDTYTAPAATFAVGDWVHIWVDLRKTGANASCIVGLYFGNSNSAGTNTVTLAAADTRASMQVDVRITGSSAEAISGVTIPASGGGFFTGSTQTFVDATSAISGTIAIAPTMFSCNASDTIKIAAWSVLRFR